jgi:hypothetical protein
MAAFAAQYGLEPKTLVLVGPCTGNLDNAGGDIALYRPEPPEGPASKHPGVVPYVLVDEVHYGVQSPWPSAANGTGRALQRLNPAAYADDPLNWVSSNPSPRGVLRIDQVQLNGGSCVLWFQATAGSSYSLLYRSVFGSGGWQKVADVAAGTTSGPAQITDTTSGTSAARFYRIVTPAMP